MGNWAARAVDGRSLRALLASIAAQGACNYLAQGNMNGTLMRTVNRSEGILPIEMRGLQGGS